MNQKERIKSFQKAIGYTFKKENILRQALTHSSYANENHMKKTACNERLEFLGDAVLELVSSEFIFTGYGDMPEGDMTKLRASFVCEPTLALCARELDLGSYLFLGNGEAMTGGAERDSILSDALEAVIGGIYVDGGFTNAKEFIDKFILQDIDKKHLFYDSKTILQEIVQSRYKEPLRYRLKDETGPDHNKKFTVSVCIGSEEIAIGTGKSKKAAEQRAAYQAILRLDER